MSDEPPSVQRSFRLSRRTLELLDQEAAATGTSRNALADRLLGEALRIQHHPLIRFHEGAGGHRRAVIVGTRLSVYQVVATVRGSDGDLVEAADYLGLNANQVRAARDYYADFREEVNADAEAAERFEAAARDRWDRQQRALA